MNISLISSNDVIISVLNISNVFVKKFHQTNSMVMAYYDNEAPFDDTILFVHGWMESKENMLEFAKIISWDCRILLVDLRGHGESSVPIGRYSLSEFSSDIADLVNTILSNDAKITLIGRSMGGMVIASLYTMIINKCVSLIFLNSSLKFQTFNVTAYLLEKLLPHLLQIDTSKITRFTRLAFGIRVNKSNLELVKETLNRANKEVGFLSYRNSISKVDLIEIIRRTNTPVLSVGGGLDTVLPSGHAKLIAQKARKGYFRFLPGCGHFSNMEYSHEVFEALRSFFKLTKVHNFLI